MPELILEKLSTFTLSESALADRVLLITGATGGYGSAIAKAATQAGASVIILGRNLTKLETLYDDLVAIGNHPPTLITLDQSQAPEQDYFELANTIHAEFGQLDGVVHASADLGVLTPLESLDQTVWNQVMAVNLHSARLIAAACLPLLRQSPLGSMVFTLDQKHSAYWGAYGVSKAALHNLSVMLADENEGKKDSNGNPLVAINAINPGPMRTALRRKAFPGEMESETRLASTRVGPMMYLLSRQDRSVTGAILS
ncbi:MAG: SDR family NAD(P)-dependent oxidoreductase [Gammaproteobacteria bacterium]|nr:SDR family NAD(P)-dependent oxidoreductase [Gammaproteobacteria bacterium]